MHKISSLKFEKKEKILSSYLYYTTEILECHEKIKEISGYADKYIKRLLMEEKAMTVIMHNLMAMNANRQFSVRKAESSKTAGKLSSGYRINGAADDAAGLQITEKMRAQIQGLHRASDNIQDGTSFVQTADGALSEVQAMLHRIKELTVKSLNDTNTATDRIVIDNEIQELKKEIDHIYTTTEFNGRKIWNEVGNNPVQMGTEPVYAITTRTTGIYDKITDTNKAVFPKTSGISSWGGEYKLNASDTGITVSWTGFNGKNYTSNEIAWPVDADGNLPAGSYTFKLGDYMDTTLYPELAGVNFFEYTYEVNDRTELTDNLAYAKEALNGRIVGCMNDPGETVDVILKDKSKGAGASFGVDIYYDALLKAGKVYDTDPDVTNDNCDDLFMEGVDKNGNSTAQENQVDNITGNPIKNSPTDPWEFTFYMNGIGEVKAKINSARYHVSDYSAEMENIWWKKVYYDNGTKWYKSTLDYELRGDEKGTIKGVERALTGGGIDFNTYLNEGQSGYINMSFSLVATNPYSNLSNTASGTGVGTMSMNIPISWVNGHLITIDEVKEKIDNIQGLDIRGSQISNGYTYNNKEELKSVQVPKYRYDYALNIQSSDNAMDSIRIEYEGVNIDSLGIKDANVRDRNSANDLLGKVDDVLAQVSGQRALFGAYANRFEHAQKIADNSAENVQAAESRIRDMDMAEGMVQYSISNILMNAAQAVLAQANRNPSGVMALLQ